MSLYIVTYILYCGIMIFIISWIGRRLYHHGRIYLLAIFKGNREKADSANHLLLMGYYLLNIGYALLKLRHWPLVSNSRELIESLSTVVGLLVIMLAVLHFFNMAIVFLIARFNHQIKL